jgi:hypothetical protein
LLHLLKLLLLQLLLKLLLVDLLLLLLSLGGVASEGLEEQRGNDREYRAYVHPADSGLLGYLIGNGLGLVSEKVLYALGTVVSVIVPEILREVGGIVDRVLLESLGEAGHGVLAGRLLGGSGEELGKSRAEYLLYVVAGGPGSFSEAIDYVRAHELR